MSCSGASLHAPQRSPLKEGEPGRDDVTRGGTPLKRRRGLNLVSLRGPVGMTSSSVELGVPSCLPPLSHPPGGGGAGLLGASSSLGHGRRARTPLTDLDSKFVTKSGLCGSIESGDPGSLRGSGSGVKITHLTGSGPSGVGVGVGVGVGGASGASRDDSVSRFPRLDQCAHFHYEYVELPPIQVSLVSEELKPLSQAGVCAEDTENRSLLVQVTSLGRSWVVRRTYDNFRFLDKQLHRCCYDRKISQLKELAPEENLLGEEKESAIESALKRYLSRLSEVAGSLITCGPVLGWLELDNRGHRLIVTDDSDINTPAVAAAYVVKRYTAQASDEISFEVGDMISVIDMPPPEESIWWRGKRGFQVGFFPCECVQVIGDKVPQAIHPQALTLPPTRSSSTPPLGGTHHSPLQASSSVSSTQEPIKPVLRKHGKLIAFFRSFILSRPSRRKLKQSGILRERVFGCDLGEHLLNSGHEIPMVLKCCAEFIESYGTVDGIYRLSGITSNIQKLRNAFDEERVPDLYGDESIRQDIHCVSSVLKMYFRELPNPLLTYQLYDKFVTAVMQNEEVRLLHVRDVVQQLPPPHYRTLEYLIQHLARIASHSSNTGMTPRNIAIVWAPNLLRSKDLEKGGVAALQDVGTQAVVTEYLVRYVDLIFNDKIPLFSPSTNGVEGTPKKLRPKSLAISTPTKLLSIDEARSRALAAIKSDQKYIEVGGGPQSLPKTYHTVIHLPSRKGGSLKQKKSPLGWKTLFSKNKHQRKASTPNDISLNISDPAVTETEMSGYSAKLVLRPVKSVESLVSTPASLHSNRNSQIVEQQAAKAEKSPVAVRERRGSVSSECSSIPSPRTHNRSVSHDSYFNLLERSASNISSSGVVKEERESDTEFSPESSKIFLDISELNLDFNTSEAEMKIFSEDDTLRSTSIEDTLSRSTVDIDENISMGSDVGKSKENVSNREKRSLKEKLKKRFTSPSTQRKENTLSDSSEDSRSNSLKRASSALKEKLVQALSPETSRKKGDPSPGGSPKPKQKKPSEKDSLFNGELHLNPASESRKSDERSEEDRTSDDEKERVSIESTLIDPELLDKITRMRVSPSVSAASEVGSVSLAEATVSDNESFTLGSSSNTGSNGPEALKGGVVSDSGSTLPQSLLTTPLTPPVTIVADAQFQEEISKREMTFKAPLATREEEAPSRIAKTPRDRPSSLLGIPTSDSCGFGSSLTSPETPQGDSTFLEIQYHPLSDTTEPSTPSECHFTVTLDGQLISSSTSSLPQLSAQPPRQSSPLSPDLSSSSTDDLVDNCPLYENVELPSLSPSILSNLDVVSNKEYYDSSSKISPEVDTPTAEEFELQYENIQYNALEQSYYDEDDSKIFESNSVAPCYENLDKKFHEESSTVGEAAQETTPTAYENVERPRIRLHKGKNNSKQSDFNSDSEYEEYSFQERPEYENLDFTKKNESQKTEAEIEGEVVYQQVKYLRRSIQEVNEILSEPSENSSSVPTPLQSINLSLCQLDSPPEDIRSEDRDSDGIVDAHISEGSECLDSPVTPSSSSLVTEVLVLPSFSSPTESTTEDATSPDASESQSSPKLQPQIYSMSPEESPATVMSSPNSLTSGLIPALSPPSPEITAVIPLVTSASNKTYNTTLSPSPWPRTGQKQSQVWPPIPKPRNLPSLNIASPLVSPSTPPSLSSDYPLTFPELSSDQTPTVEDKSFGGSPVSQPQNAVHIVKVPSSETGDEKVESERSLRKSRNKLEEKVASSECNPASDPSHIDSIPLPPHPHGEDEVQKRERIERIEKYKKDRRSYLREKYKSESFKGEKDDMILRLKQKATSPSRQEDEESIPPVDPNSKPKSGSKLNVPDSSKTEREEGGQLDHKQVVPTTNLRFQSSSHSCIKTISDSKVDKPAADSSFKVKSEPLLHRSISEDSKVVASQVVSGGKESCTLSSTNNVSKFSPTRTFSDSSTFQPKSELKGKSNDDDDINVKERVAIWSRYEGPSTALLSNKREVNNTTNNSKVTPPKLRKVQPPTAIDVPVHSKPGRTLSSPGKTYNAPSPIEENRERTSVTRNSRSPPYSQKIANKRNGSKVEYPPPVSAPKVDKKAGSPTTTVESPTTPKLPVGKGITTQAPTRKQSLATQKSECNLRGEPVPLKTRSCSVGTGLGVTPSSFRSAKAQPKTIKDMKALFEREAQNQELNRPVMIRPTSREGVGN